MVVDFVESCDMVNVGIKIEIKVPASPSDVFLESSTGEEPLRLQSDTGFSHRLGWYPCNLGKNETA